MEMKIIFKKCRSYTGVARPLPLLGVLVLMLFVSAGKLDAQQAGTSPGQTKDCSNSDERPIQDNSFLIEEAYNQENGVVQHISTYTRSWQTGEWVYTFTQEFPVRGIKHQLSYTLPVMGLSKPPGTGVGDVALNYRYQAIGSGETRVAFAPRATLLFPSGSVQAGRGTGGYGLQVNLPLSVTLGRHFVTHWNAGATVIPSAQNANGDRAPITGYNLGQSTIWLAHPRFNVLLETLWTGFETVVGPRRTQRSHEFLISPGVRWAYNFKNGLQIVPGIGIPVGVGPSHSKTGLILYLSFEHPWAAFRKN